MCPKIRPVVTWLRKEKKCQKLSCVKLAIFPDHPRRHIPLKFCVRGRVREVVIYFKFHENRSRGLGAVGGRKSPSPIDKAHGLYNSLYYRTSRDYCAASTFGTTASVWCKVKKELDAESGCWLLVPLDQWTQNRRSLCPDIFAWHATSLSILVGFSECDLAQLLLMSLIYDSSTSRPVCCHPATCTAWTQLHFECTIGLIQSCGWYGRYTARRWRCFANNVHCMAYLQRHCRTFLLQQSYQQRLQQVIVLQAGVRRIIAEKQYRRMKLEVCCNRWHNTFASSISFYLQNRT